MPNLNKKNHKQINEMPEFENFADLFEQSIENEKAEGAVVQGVVIGIEKDLALIDVGLKSEGRVLLKEFADLDGNTNIKIGDVVDVYVERIEGRFGRTVLSREKALREEAWGKFEELNEKGVNVDGKIIGRVKGGFAVDIGGLIAFLPGSQVDIRPIKDVAVLMFIVQPFKILKMDREQGNVVVSRRAILEESRTEARNELLSNIAEGSVLEGTVKNITDYGAFIDLESLDGLLHITDISWHKISHPSEVLTIGQKIKVMVIKYNPETKRVSLGLKQLESNPWEGLSEKYTVGQKFKGSVTTVADYGAFIELEPNVEGLVYHTEISWNAKNIHPRKLLKTGDEVEVVVLEIDIAKHRISLSIKQCKENPWQKFADQYQINQVVEGVVKNIADFGLFVTINDEIPDLAIDALVPTVELTWADNPESILAEYKKGDIVKAVILTCDVERERVTLSVKQLSNNTSSQSSAAKFSKGSSVTCSILSVQADGIEVELPDGLKAFIKKNELSKHKAEQRSERFAVGDRVDAMIITTDKDPKKISLSIKALEIDEEKKAIAEYGSTDSGASLGDILGAALGQSKSTNAAKAAKESAVKSKDVSETESEGEAEDREAKPKKATRKSKENTSS